MERGMSSSLQYLRRLSERVVEVRTVSGSRSAWHRAVRPAGFKWRHARPLGLNTPGNHIVLPMLSELTTWATGHGHGNEARMPDGFAMSSYAWVKMTRSSQSYARGCMIFTATEGVHDLHRSRGRV